MFPIPSHIVQLIRQLDRETVLAARVHDWAAARKHDAKETTRDTLARQAGCNTQEAMRLMRHYEAIDCARVVRGDSRTGTKTRLVWKHSLIAIGRCARI